MQVKLLSVLIDFAGNDRDVLCPILPSARRVPKMCYCALEWLRDTVEKILVVVCCWISIFKIMLEDSPTQLSVLLTCSFSDLLYAASVHTSWQKSSRGT